MAKVHSKLLEHMNAFTCVLILNASILSQNTSVLQTGDFGLRHTYDYRTDAEDGDARATAWAVSVPA